MMQLATSKPLSQFTPAKTPLKIEVVNITPGMAQAWLEKNINNRDVKSQKVRAYARDILSGKWQLTGDAIRFSTEGRLIDGQHRLKACISADMPFQSLVIYDLADETQDVIDTNAIRSGADVLKLNGISYWNKCAPAAKLLLEIEKGESAPTMRGVTNAEMMDVIRRHPRLVSSAGIVMNAKPRGCHLTTLIVLHYIGLHFSERPDDAAAFLEVFKTGIPRYTGDAAHATRERFLRVTADSAKLPGSVQCLLMIQAWNNFTQRRQVAKVQIPSSAMIVGLDRNKLRKGTK